MTMSGTTTVTTLQHTWTGRQITILTAAAVPFNTGGNICNALTATANVPVLGYYDGPCWHLK